MRPNSTQGIHVLVERELPTYLGYTKREKKGRVGGSREDMASQRLESLQIQQTPPHASSVGAWSSQSTDVLLLGSFYFSLYSPRLLEICIGRVFGLFFFTKTRRTRSLVCVCAECCAILLVVQSYKCAAAISVRRESFVCVCFWGRLTGQCGFIIKLTVTDFLASVFIFLSFIRRKPSAMPLDKEVRKQTFFRKLLVFPNWKQPTSSAQLVPAMFRENPQLTKTKTHIFFLFFLGL